MSNKKQFYLSLRLLAITWLLLTVHTAIAANQPKHHDPTVRPILLMPKMGLLLSRLPIDQAVTIYLRQQIIKQRTKENNKNKAAGLIQTNLPIYKNMPIFSMSYTKKGTTIALILGKQSRVGDAVGQLTLKKITNSYILLEDNINRVAIYMDGKLKYTLITNDKYGIKK